MTKSQFQFRFPCPFDHFGSMLTREEYLRSCPDRGLQIALDAVDESLRVYSALERENYMEGDFLTLYRARTTCREERGINDFGDLGILAKVEFEENGIKDYELSDELLLDIIHRYCLEPEPESYLPYLWKEMGRLFAKGTGRLPGYMTDQWNNQPGSQASRGALEIANKYWKELGRYQFGELIHIVSYTCASDGVDFLEKVFHSNERPDMDEPDPVGETVRYQVWAARAGLSQRGWVNAPNPLPKPKLFPPVED